MKTILVKISEVLPVSIILHILEECKTLEHYTCDLSDNACISSQKSRGVSLCRVILWNEWLKTEHKILLSALFFLFYSDPYIPNGDIPKDFMEKKLWAMHSSCSNEINLPVLSGEEGEKVELKNKAHGHGCITTELKGSALLWKHLRLLEFMAC